MRYGALVLYALLVLVGGCGGESGSSLGPPPDLTGTWAGVFDAGAGGVSLAITLMIAEQNDRDFSGSWQDDTPNGPGLVTGFLYPGNDGHWNVDLTLTRGDDITCCTPILGCYVWPTTQISMFGPYANGTGGSSIFDDATSYNTGCFITAGAMTLLRP